MFATIFAACNRISGGPVVGGMITFMCKYHAKIVVGACIKKEFSCLEKHSVSQMHFERQLL